MIRLVTLGRLSVHRDHVEIRDLLARKVPLALLVHLAVEREAPREKLAALFWAERAPDRARHSLSQALYDLTSQLGDDWLAGRRDVVRVNERLSLDVVDLEASVAAEDVDAALELYGGHFLDGFAVESPGFEHWAARRRASCERMHRRLLRDLVTREIRDGRLSEALRHARRWAELHPSDDEGQHRLIELLAAIGERGEALSRYESYRALLAADDLRPLDATAELVERIRAGEATISPTGLEEAPEPVAADVHSAAAGSTVPRTRPWGGGDVSGPRLVRIAEGGREAESYPLGRGKTVIGRQRGDLLFSHDEHLSGVHASITARPVAMGGEELRFVLRDEGSRNGVFVRVVAPWTLQAGDSFVVGRQVFRLELPEAE